MRGIRGCQIGRDLFKMGGNSETPKWEGFRKRQIVWDLRGAKLRMKVVKLSNVGPIFNSLS